METKYARITVLRSLLATNAGLAKIVEIYKARIGHFPPWGVSPHAMIDAIAEIEEAAKSKQAEKREKG